MSRPVVILDFDRTLFDVDSLIAEIRRRLESRGVRPDMWDTAYTARDEDGVWRMQRFVAELAERSGKSPRVLSDVIERELQDGAWYLFSDTRAFLDSLSGRAELVLFTFGDHDWQRRKLTASGLADYFDTVHVVEEPKHQSRSLSVPSVGQAIFINDNERELLDVAGVYRWAYHLHINRTGRALPPGFRFPSYAGLDAAGEAIESLLQVKA